MAEKPFKRAKPQMVILLGFGDSAPRTQILAQTDGCPRTFVAEFPSLWVHDGRRQLSKNHYSMRRRQNSVFFQKKSRKVLFPEL